MKDSRNRGREVLNVLISSTNVWRVVCKATVTCRKRDNDGEFGKSQIMKA
jgi:hypothetical protein